jgi:hypothetical protein
VERLFRSNCRSASPRPRRCSPTGVRCSASGSRTHPERCCMRQHAIPQRSRGRAPEVPARVRESPQGSQGKHLLSPGIPAYRPSGPERRDRPVTPEVAGSSPVAPAENILQIGIFCCLARQGRPPASCAPRADPAAVGKGPFAGTFSPAGRNARLPSRTTFARAAQNGRNGRKPLPGL